MFQEKLLTWLQSKRYQVIILLTGIFLIGVGLLSTKFAIFTDPEVQVLTASPLSQPAEIIVDIAGGVEKPGVYNLPFGSRIEDLLVAAGGLSEDADRQIIEQKLNRAAKLVDGQKLYIPKIGEQTQVLSANNSSTGLTTSQDINQNSAKTVNINTASASELENLWGIGPVTAQKIIEHRPYSNPEELVTKKIIKENVWEKNKDLLVVY